MSDNTFARISITRRRSQIGESMPVVLTLNSTEQKTVNDGEKVVFELTQAPNTLTVECPDNPNTAPHTIDIFAPQGMTGELDFVYPHAFSSVPNWRPMRNDGSEVDTPAPPKRERTKTPLLFFVAILFGFALDFLVAFIVSLILGNAAMPGTAIGIGVTLLLFAIGGVLLGIYIKKVKGKPELRPSIGAIIALSLLSVNFLIITVVTCFSAISSYMN